MTSQWCGKNSVSVQPHSLLQRNTVDCAWTAFQWVAFQGAPCLDLEARGAMAMAMAQEGQASSPSLEATAFLLVLGELE